MTMKNSPRYTIQWFDGMAGIDRLQWDRLAVPLETPLLEWRWLHELEASGSIAPDRGWHPCHMTIRDGPELIAAAPFYIKTHSEGEFVFDHGLAHLADKIDVAYYPKLVGMSPATPAVGYRFLMRPEEDQAGLLNIMLDAVDSLCRRLSLSGCHLLFVDPQWLDAIPRNRFFHWHHQSFLWRNAGFVTFDDYLNRFNTNQRRNIRRERRSMTRQGIDIRMYQGDDIPSGWDRLMYDCYLDTNRRYGPWAAKYLNADVFERLFRHHRQRLLLAAAFQNNDLENPVSLSLLLVKGRQLIGRYWGTVRPIKDMHFNMCFYAPIQWAIAHGIETFDPGAGSSHKIYRGFEAVSNTSLHRIYDPQLSAYFQRFVEEVSLMEQSSIDALNARLPFARLSSRKDGATAKCLGRI